MFQILFNNVTGNRPDPGDRSSAESEKRSGGTPSVKNVKGLPEHKILNERYRRSNTLNSAIKIEPFEKRPAKLPFVKRKTDAGQWMYEHRTGVITTVALYMFAVILFLSLRVSVDSRFITQGMLVEFPPQEQSLQAEEQEQQKMTQEEFDRQMLQGIRNVASDENARLDAGLKDDRGTKANDIYAAAREVQEKMDANRRRYEEGLKEEAAVRNTSPQRDREKGDNDKIESVKVSGNVTGSYNVGGRTAVYFPIPAYRCEGGGKAVVQIMVNRNGNVVSASIDKPASTNNTCILDMALQFAKMARFNTDAQAPERQPGTISYIFVPQ